MNEKEKPLTFTAEQLVQSKVLHAAPDVVRAVLQDEPCTLAEAKKRIKTFLERKVQT